MGDASLLPARRSKRGRAGEVVDLVAGKDDWDLGDEEDVRVRSEGLQGSFCDIYHVGIATLSKDAFVGTFGSG
jgi:hypothetical protein